MKRGEREAQAILPIPPIPYKKDGKRLLHVSRVVLRRVLLLGLHFHLTGDAALATRAQEEMLNATTFADWNPSHFLDVGEMTAALAFGCDWLYDQLDETARKSIVTAIIEKGLRSGLTHDGGASAENNWNAVCLGGLALGALAVADEEPTLAAQILDKVKQNNPRGLKVYAPAGVYPEGPMYWGYGTTFEVILIAALQSALGTDWGLSQSPGFLQSGDATRQLLGPTGKFFDFSDGVERPGTEPAMWWYAHALKRPDLLRYDRERMSEYAASTHPPQPTTEDDRLLPLAALWWPDADAPDDLTRRPLHWYGPGPNPLAVFRNAWDNPQAMFLALKGGSAALSHAHMDAGSFVFEANGVRWGRDLGMQDYLSLESKGVDLWNMTQDSQRWDVFRLGPFSHSTLTVNGQHHHAAGHAAITHFADAKDAGAIVDLTPVFAGQAKRVTRGFAFRPDSHVLIRDEIEGLTPGAVMRWAMLTKANVTIGDNAIQATLREAGQTLGASLHSSEAAKWEIISAETPVHSYDAPNPGARLLIANLTAPVSGKLTVTVTLQPGAAKPMDDTLAQTELSQWPMPPVKMLAS